MPTAATVAVIGRTAGNHLRKRTHALGPWPIEHGEAKRLEDAPGRLERQHGFLAVVLPGPQQISGAQQLGAKAAVVSDTSDQQSVNDEQSEAIARDRCAFARVPVTPFAAQDARHAQIFRSGSHFSRKRSGQVLVGLEHGHAL